jgi:hypothetical protein
MGRKNFIKFFLIVLVFFSLPFLVGAEKEFVPGSSKVIEGRKVYAEQCNPCHVDFNRFKRPNLIFKHGYHQLVPCEACHEVYPHSPDKTVRPKMRACLACHGLYHKGKLIARGECLVCHYKAKKPSSHTPGWEKKGHTKESPKKCIDCHQPNFCESCHAKQNVPPLPPNSYALPTFAQPLFTLNLYPPIKMEDCIPCHKDLDTFKNEFLIFKHNVHLEKGYDCSACHQEKAHQPDKVSRPKMEVCYSCHAQPHLNLKKRIIATEDCYACHPRGKMRLPQDHTYLFRTKEHGSYAKRNLSYCYMCHKESFCQNCHLRERVIPDDHKVKDWKNTHGKEKYSRVSACTPCHSQKKFCYNCHPVKMPHPLNWLLAHGEAGRVSIDVCRTCHRQRGLDDYCQSCHHTEVAGAFLKRENCVKCHPQFRLHFLKLRQEDYAIHAAHFDIKGRDPFECFECHKKKYVGTAISKFEVCKECHGKERLGRLVAPYNVDNGELCSRCHRTSKRGISIPRLY